MLQELMYNKLSAKTKNNIVTSLLQTSSKNETQNTDDLREHNPSIFSEIFGLADLVSLNKH